MTPLVIELTGDGAVVSDALDRVHLHTDVRGVVEHEPGRVEVAVDATGAEPGAWFLGLPGLAWRIVPAPIGPPPTGLERDAPILVTERLLVRPPWVPAPADFHGLELIVPRGMAFGSGEHGSTQAALAALEQAWPERTPEVVCDVGTGSGVLARYAQARGAGRVHRVLACDVDPAAVDAATELLEGADVRIGGPEVFAPGCADLVVANLDDEQLDHALPAILALWNRRAPLVLSGMRPARIQDHVHRVGRPPDIRIERGGFVALTWRPDHVPHPA